MYLSHLKDLKTSNVKHTNEEGTSFLKELLQSEIWHLNHYFLLNCIMCNLYACNFILFFLWEEQAQAFDFYFNLPYGGFTRLSSLRLLQTLVTRDWWKNVLLIRLCYISTDFFHIQLWAKSFVLQRTQSGVINMRTRLTARFAGHLGIFSVRFSDTPLHPPLNKGWWQLKVSEAPLNKSHT